jgi:DnaJ homolog subfamily C member 11
MCYYHTSIIYDQYSRLFVFGPWFEYGIDRQLTKFTHGSASVAICSRMGVLLRLKSIERYRLFDIYSVVYIVFRFTRGSQSFAFPLQLSQDIMPSAIFYATTAPILAFFILDRLIIRPLTQSEHERYVHCQQWYERCQCYMYVCDFDSELKRHDDDAREKQAERRREAINAQEVLRSLIEQIRDREGSQGLIIVEGRYGQLTSTTNSENSSKIIDVTVPLQALVKDSTLKITSTVSKSNLIGFYDPCIGEEKSLLIKYTVRSEMHTILYNDTDPILLPNRGRH